MSSLVPASEDRPEQRRDLRIVWGPGLIYLPDLRSEFLEHIFTEALEAHGFCNFDLSVEHREEVERVA